MHLQLSTRTSSTTCIQVVTDHKQVCHRLCVMVEGRCDVTASRAMIWTEGDMQVKRPGSLMLVVILQCWKPVTPHMADMLRTRCTLASGRTSGHSKTDSIVREPNPCGPLGSVRMKVYLHSAQDKGGHTTSSTPCSSATQRRMPAKLALVVDRA